MSERKVLNKYYPPDFDPTKIPKLKGPRNHTFCIRIMAPFNMRCNTCGEFIYKGKKFNSRKETVDNENYLGLRIYRFYIKCPRCVAEIAFKTDPHNTDYEMEDGATRNFEALRTLEIQAKAEAEAKEADEANNPMKLLENRTRASQREMDMIETLEDLRNLNSRHATVDHDSIIKAQQIYVEQLAKLQEEHDENMVKSIFGRAGEGSLKRLPDEEEEEEEETPSLKHVKNDIKTDKPTDILAKSSTSMKPPAAWERSIGGLSTSKKALGMLVKKKKPVPKSEQAEKSSPISSSSSSSSSLPNDFFDTPKVDEAVHEIAVPRDAPGEPSVAPVSSSNQSKEEIGQSSSVAQSGQPSSSTITGKPSITVLSGQPSSSNTSVSSALGMLGGYSDSDSNQSDSS